MTAAPIRAGSRLVDAAEAAINDTASEMVDAFVDDIPVYAQLPREQVRGEIRALCRTSLQSFFALLREGRPLDDHELAEPRASAARRAEEQIPLDAVLTAYHLGARITWESLCRLARPDEQAELLAHAAGILTYLQRISGAVSRAYMEEQHTIAGETRDAQRALAQALIDGVDLEDAASRVGTMLGGSYAVAAFAVTGEIEHGLGGRVAARRRQRRIQEALDGIAGEPVPCLVGPDGGLVILRSWERTDAELVDGVTDLVTTLREAAGREVMAVAAGAGDATSIPAAAQLARELIQLVADLGRPPGGYRLADLLLEYQLTRPSAARAPLAGLLDPLLCNPDFLPTLTTWLEVGADRRRAAMALHVHPNTMDYRLRRIGELTGIEPASGRGSHLLAAAVAARRLEMSDETSPVVRSPVAPAHPRSDTSAEMRASSGSRTLASTT